MTERRNLADSIKILKRSNTSRFRDSWHRRSPCPDNSLAQIMLHRNKTFVAAKIVGVTVF
jgi:hypothetical protein